MTAWSAAALLMRRVKAEGGILLLLFVLVALTSFIFAAAPRVLNRVTDDAVRYAVRTAPSVDRDVALTASGFIGPGSEGGVSAVRAYGEEREADFPASIDRLVSDRAVGVTSVRFAVPQSIVGLYLRYQDGIEEASTLAAGRWPVDVGMRLRQLPLGQSPAPGDVAAPTTFEVALSTVEAGEIDAHVGDRLQIGLDRSDSLVPRSVFAITPTQLEVVGLFDPIDPTADMWTGSGLLQPSLKQGADGIEAIYATALVAPEAYPTLQTSLLPFNYDWHYRIDPDRLDADQVAALQPDMRRLSLIASPKDERYLSSISSVVGLTEVSVGSGLLRVLDGVAAQRARSESVLSIAALGLLGLAAGATGMVGILLVRRRRSGLLLARGRGASGRLLLGAQLLEGALLAGSAAVVGLLVAVLVVPARDSPLSPIAALAAAVVTTLLLMAATWSAARRPLIQLERDDSPALRVSPRRLVLEGSIVVIALVAIVLLRQRGLTLGATTAAASFDPLLAAVPLLTGIAVGIVVMRLYSVPVRWLGGLAARRRDFVPVVGLRTVARHPATANLTLLVLMLTAAFGAFASVVESSVDRGQVVASYLQVGADFRLEEVGIGGLPVVLDPISVPGVAAVAAGAVDNTADLVTGPGRRATVDFVAVDAPAYNNVTAGTAAQPAWPATFVTPPTGTGLGTDANPIPVVLSSQLPAGMADPNIGGTITIGTDQQSLKFRVVGRQDDLPGHGDLATFAIVPLDWIKLAVPDMSFLPTVMWLRASSDAAAPLAAAASAASERVRIVSRPDAYAALHGAPLGSAVADFFGIALVVAVVYMAVTLVGAVIVSAAGRTRDLAYLRTLGVSARQAQGLTVVEHAPPVLLALVPGVLLGVAVALLVEPGLGLAEFVGAPGVPLFVDWRTLIVVIVALTAVVVVAIAAGTWLAGRARLASALRIEDL